MRLLLAALLACWATLASADNLLTMGVSGASVVLTSLCSGTDNSAASVITCTTTTVVPAGNSIVVIGGEFSGFGFDSVSDGTANAYTIEQTTAATMTVAVAWVVNPVQVNSGSTITMHWPTFTSVRQWIQVYAVSTTLKAAYGAGNSGSSTTPSCTADSARYGFGGVYSIATGDTMVQPTGWIAGLTGNVGVAQEQATAYNAGGLGTYNPTGFTNQSWACQVKSFFLSTDYVGPGNVVPSALAWWGLRCYNNAKAGASQAINIRRASDSTTTDIGLTATCNLDVATATTFCASTTCFVTKVYDQTGNGRNIAQATAANQPQLILSCLGSLPCMRFDGVNDYLDTTAFAQAQPFTVSDVATRTGNFTTIGTLIRGDNGTQFIFRYAGAANQVHMYAGTSPAAKTASDSAWHAFNVVFNGASSVLKVDATDNTVNAGTNGLTGGAQNLTVGTVPGGGSEYFTGDLTEEGVWGSGFSATSRTNMCNNQYTYWGTSTSC